MRAVIQRVSEAHVITNGSLIDKNKPWSPCPRGSRPCRYTRRCRLAGREDRQTTNLPRRPRGHEPVSARHPRRDSRGQSVHLARQQLKKVTDLRTPAPLHPNSPNISTTRS